MQLSEAQANSGEKTPQLPAQRLRWRRYLTAGWLALLFFIVATVAFTWPLSLRLSDSLPDWGDPPDVGWRMGTIAQQLRSDPLNLYQTSAFYPLKNGLALNELLTGMGLLAAPIYWLTNNPPLAYNTLNFLSYALSGFAMWLLVRHLTGSFGAGLVAGLIYAFSPWHYGQYGHLPLAAQQWMIFALYFLIRFLEPSNPDRPRLLSRRSLLYLSLFVLFFVLQAIVAGYFAYFETILIGFYLIYHFVFRAKLLKRFWIFPWFGGRRFWIKKNGPKQPSSLFTLHSSLLAQAGLVGVALLVAFLLILPFALPFIQYQREFGFKRDLSEVNYWSAAPNSLLRTTEQSWLYNPVQRGIFKLQTSAERMMYPGLIAVLLGLVALFRWRGGDGRRWLFAAVSLTGLILSFGPTLNLEAYGLNSTGISLPYQWLYQFVPGFDALRVSQRFGQLFMLGIAVCAGYGVARLEGKVSSSRFQVPRFKQLETRNLKPGTSFTSKILVGLLLVLVTADFIAPGVPLRATGTGENAPPLYKWLAGSEAAGVIPKDALLLELPISDQKTPVTSNPIYLMYSLSHGRPMLNGSANIVPPGYDRLFYEMQSFPNIATLDIIEGLGVKFIVVHPAGLAADANRAELERQARPNGRLELVRSFEAYDGNPQFKDAVYRVKPNPKRFEKLATLIPEGAEVLLADHPNGRKLYTAVLPNLIGSNRRYYSTYSTIYSRNVPSVRPNRVYEYAIFYRGSGVIPTEYGYNPSDLVTGTDNSIVEVYRKRPGLDSFFSFRESANSARYLPFSAQNAAWLGVEENTVRHIEASQGAKLTQQQSNLRSLTLILATAETQTVVLKSGSTERKLKIEPGFYRWRVNVSMPGALELKLASGGWAYLVQARLYSEAVEPDNVPEQLKGVGGAIVQATNSPQEGEPGVVNSRMVYYIESRPNPAEQPNLFFQLDVGVPTPVRPANAKEVPNTRRFGEWAVPVPGLLVGSPQVVEIRLDLLQQKAQGFANGQEVTPAIAMPLSTAEGVYKAEISILQVGPNQPVQASPLNAEVGRVINTYQFRYSRANSQPAVSELRYDAPNALITLPSVDG